MVEISIISLIYRSAKLADWVYESLYKFTPMLRDGTAEFFFVANDPTDALLSHLYEKKYPFILNRNKKQTEEDLFINGFGAPEYMSRVYMGYNQGILNAKGSKIVLINSDNFFSPDWLENLLKYSDYKSIVTSTLVEPGHEKYGVFPGAYNENFGNHPDNFLENDFLKYVNRVKKTGLRSGGAYMPCLMYKDVAIYAGLYPEGNIAGEEFKDIKKFGDEFFFEKLENLGLSHITAMDSIVYHLKEGEKDDNVENNALIPHTFDIQSITCAPYHKMPEVSMKELNTFIKPTILHDEIIKKLLLKITIIIPISDINSSWDETIKSALEQTHKNTEIIVVNNGCDAMILEKAVKEKFGESVRLYRKERGMLCWAIDFGIEKMSGEYFCWINQNEILLDSKIKTQVDFLINSIKKNIILYSSAQRVAKNVVTGTDFENSGYSKNSSFVNSTSFLFPKNVCKTRLFLDESSSINDLRFWQEKFSNFEFIDQKTDFIRIDTTEISKKRTPIETVKIVLSIIRSQGFIALFKKIMHKILR